MKDFQYLIDNLQESIFGFDFFVDWKKPKEAVKKHRVELCILNSLLFEEDIEGKLATLIRQYPNIVPVLPLLLAYRKDHAWVFMNNSCKDYSFKQKDSYEEGR